MNSSSNLVIVCLAIATATSFACSQVAAVGFFKPDPSLKSVAEAELIALDRDAEELVKISSKYLKIAQNLLKEREQTDDSFIGIAGKCIIVSHKVRNIEHERRELITRSLKGTSYLVDLQKEIVDAHWGAYGAVEPLLNEIAIMSNSPPKVNFLPDLLQIEQLLLDRLEQVESIAQNSTSDTGALRPRSASVA